MLVFLLIVMVLIGVAYADYCLIDNTAHFGICFNKVAETEEARVDALRDEVEEIVAPAPEAPFAADPDPRAPAWAPAPPQTRNGIPVRPPRSPAPAWLLLELEPVLELHEGLANRARDTPGVAPHPHPGEDGLRYPTECREGA